MSDPTLELRHFRFFVAVAETGSFTRAAERLSVSQPAISRQVAQLEKLLGSVLFDRNGHHVRLTESGHRFEVEAREVLRKADDATRVVSEVENSLGGVLTVGMVPVCNAALAVPLLRTFGTEFPAVQVTVDELSSLDIESRLESGSMDLGLGFLSYTAPTIEYDQLLRSEFVLVASAKHPLAKRTAVTLDELAGHRLALLPRRFHMRNLIDNLFQLHCLRPRVLLENSSISALLAFAAASDNAATLLPSFVSLGNFPKRLRALPIKDAQPPLEIGLMSARGKARSGPAKAFSKVIKILAAQWGDEHLSNRVPQTTLT